MMANAARPGPARPASHPVAHRGLRKRRHDPLGIRKEKQLAFMTWAGKAATAIEGPHERPMFRPESAPYATSPAQSHARSAPAHHEPTRRRSPPFGRAPGDHRVRRHRVWQVDTAAPSYALAAGRGRPGDDRPPQPRRIAARWRWPTAWRLNWALGPSAAVGCQVRSRRPTRGRKCRVKLMTDGILLRPADFRCLTRTPMTPSSSTRRTSAASTSISPRRPLKRLCAPRRGTAGDRHLRHD